MRQVDHTPKIQLTRMWTDAQPDGHYIFALLFLLSSFFFSFLA